MNKIEKLTVQVKCSNPQHEKVCKQDNVFNIIIPKGFDLDSYQCPKCKNGKLSKVKGGA